MKHSKQLHMHFKYYQILINVPHSINMVKTKVLVAVVEEAEE